MNDIWSPWEAFPDPEEKGWLTAPFGPGIFQLRHKSNGQLLTYGSAKHCAHRMTSLLPPPLGLGTHKNENLLNYIADHLEDIEYQCIACTDEKQMKKAEAFVKEAGQFLFS